MKVAVIGVTNPEAPTLVAPGALGTIEITDGVSPQDMFVARAGSFVRDGST